MKEVDDKGAADVDFIRGVDVSMTKELEEHGAEYFLDGEKRDLFEILALCGVNLVRLRLWNHPYSNTGEAYGGGTNDLPATVALARRIIENGMDFMLDFQYSDFWADPAKQIKPKQWENITGYALRNKVYDYTKEVLLTLEREKVIPSIVQIGNEVTNGLLWPEGNVKNTKEMAMLLDAGILAVREFNSDIRVALHLDFGTDNAMYRKWFSDMEPFRLAFDMIGMSFYPFWNGSIEALIENMNDISKRFDKDVFVAETSIGYTTDNLGCNGIVFSKEMEEKTDYPATKEGQLRFMRDLYHAVRYVKDGRGAAILYWEPGWLPIRECAWANPIGCKYMNDIAELGNSWANQALFDEHGNANPALTQLSTM